MTHDSAATSRCTQGGQQAVAAKDASRMRRRYRYSMVVATITILAATLCAAHLLSMIVPGRQLQALGYLVLVAVLLYVWSRAMAAYDRSERELAQLPDE